MGKKNVYILKGSLGELYNHLQQLSLQICNDSFLYDVSPDEQVSQQ